MDGVNITLSHEKSEELFLNALCNAVGSGYMQGYGLRFGTERPSEYTLAKESLIAKAINPCTEDVWMEALRLGFKLKFFDEEGDGDNDSVITLEDVHERVAKTPLEHLFAMIGEQDDVVTADVMVQTVFFREVIFG